MFEHKEEEYTLYMPYTYDFWCYKVRKARQYRLIFRDRYEGAKYGKNEEPEKKPVQVPGRIVSSTQNSK